MYVFLYLVFIRVYEGPISTVTVYRTGHPHASRALRIRRTVTQFVKRQRGYVS